jgi:hypothetical protein
MPGRKASFEDLIARLDAQLKPEFAQFLRDLAKQRAEKIALECLVDGLNDTGVRLSLALVQDLDAACRAAGVDDGRRLIVGKLMLASGVGHAGVDRDGGPGVSLADLVAADDPVALGRAHGVSEVMLVRALREKHGVSLGEAVALLQMVRPQG